MGAAGWTRDGRLQDFIRFWSDFGTCLCQFLEFKMLKIRFFSGLFPGHFLSISESKFRRLGLPNRGFRMEGIAKIDFSWKSFLMNFGIDFYVFWMPWEPFF